MKFTEFGFSDQLLEGIEAINYETATPVQEQVIPRIINGKDLIVSAQTGTGKTASYLLPILQRILTEEPSDHVKALVIVPTRELAIQISQNLEGFSYFTSVSSIAVYGGGDGNTYANERQALSHGADIVICTPGRMISHLNMGYAKIKHLKYLVLDEADRMLDMGFHEDIMKIISFLPKQRQNLLLSATMPPKIRELAKKILYEPDEIFISISKPPARIVQQVFVVYQTQKIALVQHLLKMHNFPSVLIFCSRKENVKQLARELKRAKFSAEEIHSDLEQNDREQVLSRFRSRQLSILVATDILARGIDIDNISLVINYDVPHDGEDYVHRVGRTARAETDGIAYTFVGETEQRKFGAIERLLGEPVPRGIVPEELGATPTFNPGAAKRSVGRKNNSDKKRRSKGRKPKGSSTNSAPSKQPQE
ncbi:DEAD/DEAH box helicase [Tellurirhabdus bombi]|uniref:DEAD/DEAH box helicase n=1 Tax=Tellurirhabdus bombi TaxID=2907205 RepID=UPI001F2BBB05|nr:DEAD/DEAH box helicase [Tellurirhabdus bombi]